MSYEIIYSKQFIKLSNDRFIPMVLAGSNNCYEVNWNGREKRSRSWNNLTYFALEGETAGTLDEMLANLEEHNNDYRKRNPDYDESRYGYFASLEIRGTKTNWGNLLGLYKTGCKKALSVEELNENGIHFFVYSYPHEAEEEKLRAISMEPFHTVFKTTEEIEDFIQNVEPKLKAAKISFYYSMNASEEQITRIRRKYFASEPKEKKEVTATQGFAIEILDYGYFTKKTRSGFLYSRHEDGGKQFLKEKDAQKKAKEFESKTRHKTKVVPIHYSRPRSFRV